MGGIYIIRVISTSMVSCITFNNRNIILKSRQSSCGLFCFFFYFSQKAAFGQKLVRTLGRLIEPPLRSAVMFFLLFFLNSLSRLTFFQKKHPHKETHTLFFFSIISHRHITHSLRLNGPRAFEVVSLSLSLFVNLRVGIYTYT